MNIELCINFLVKDIPNAADAWKVGTNESGLQYISHWDEGILGPVPSLDKLSSLSMQAMEWERIKNIPVPVTQTEEEIQNAKSDDLKKLENKFLLFCDQITGSTEHKKLSIPEITAIGETIADPVVKLGLTVQLLSIDAALKVLNGNRWWDTCGWHPEVVGV